MSPSQEVVTVSPTYMTDLQAAQLCEVFAQGLDSGLNYARILNFLERKGLGGQIAKNLQRALVDEGLRISEAFAKYGILDKNARKLIYVAEDQGTLPQVFKSQVPIYQDRHDRKVRILGTFAEPALIFFLGVGFLLPILSNISRIMDSSSKIMAAASYMAEPLIFCMVSLAAAGTMAYAWLKSPVDSGARKAMNAIWISLPIVSGPSRMFSQALFCRYLGLSIRSGMNIFDSIILSMEASNDPRFEAYKGRVIKSIEDGLTLEAAVGLVPFLDENVMDYLALGEETGRMSDMLMECGDRVEQIAKDKYERMITAFVFIFRLIMIFGVLGFALFKGLFSELLPQMQRTLDSLPTQQPSTRPPGY